MVDMKISDLSRWSAHFHKTNVTSILKRKKVKQNSVTNFLYETQPCGAKMGNRKDEFELEFENLQNNYEKL